MPVKIQPYEILYHRAEVYFKHRNYEVASNLLKIPRTTLVNQVKQFEKHYKKDYIKLVEMDHRDWTIPNAKHVEIKNNCALIGGDLHAWPNQIPLMWKAFVAVGKKIKPQCIVLNGDIIDGARVSRHGSLLNSKLPKISEEIEAAKNLINMLPRTDHRFWTMGNHDQRVDNYLANNAPELDDYAGMLSDRFSDWKFCYSLHVNEVEVRHRFRGGIHTAWNNALHSGVSMVTGHTHQLQVTAVRNRKGSHWGIEAGMLGDPLGRQFEYTEGAPSRAQEGFVVLSFDEDGHLMPPEFCEMVRGHPVFRGKRVF